MSSYASFPIYKNIKQLEFRKGLFGRLWLFAGGLRSLAVGWWSFAGSLWSFPDSLWWFVVICWWFVIVCTRLWWFVVATCFSNYNFKLINHS